MDVRPHGQPPDQQVIQGSILLLTWFLGRLFGLSPGAPANCEPGEPKLTKPVPHWSRKTAPGILTAFDVALAFDSELLTGSIQPVADALASPRSSHSVRWPGLEYL